MKKDWSYLLIFLTLMSFCLTVRGQGVLQTLVTSGPIVAGEPFQVQYVMEETDEESEFFAPDFKGFRFVSGPNVYTGSAFGKSGPRKLKNIVYTLAATVTGKCIVPGASVRIGNRLYKSNSASLQVITRDQSLRHRKKKNAPVNEDIFLHPGENVNAKINRNLFIRVLVDKKTCYVGEPVTAVFKLYSRLDSRSDIVKNPGFYGFSVHDMINLDNRISTTEVIDGKNFDVHIVRKVQLYPLSAGFYEVDPMEVRNRVRFSRSAVSKTAEQEIVEGVVPFDEEEDEANSIVVESEMATQPVSIRVKPVPQRNQPADYSGATGSFKVYSSLYKSGLSRNQEGELIVTLSGQGNFSQLSAPAIPWPEGLDVFDPVIRDSLDIQHVPLRGKREFHYRFVSNRPGTYTVPAIRFSFFNPDTNSFKTVESDPLQLIVNKDNPELSMPVAVNPVVAKTGSPWFWIAGSLLFFAFLTYIYMYMKRKKATPYVVEETSFPHPTIPELLHQASLFSGKGDRIFYTALRQGIWQFFEQRFGLTGGTVNKSRLNMLLSKKGIDRDIVDDLMQVISDCETGEFANVQSVEHESAMVDSVRVLLEKIEKGLVRS